MLDDRFLIRVWDNKEKCYLSNTIVKLENNHLVIDNVLILDTDDRYTVEQCTGLKDKNDQFIYESDILGNDYGLPVIWCNECKSFELGFPTKKGCDCTCCSGDILWAEVIDDAKANRLIVSGTIHDSVLTEKLFGILL